MVWTQLLAEEDLPVDTAQQEEKRKTATILEELSDGLHEMQKHGGRYGRDRHLGIWEWIDSSSCIDPNNNNK